MGISAPRVGDKVIILGDVLDIVGLGRDTVTVKDDRNQVRHLDRRNEGMSWDLMKSVKSFAAKTGAKTMQKQAFTGLVLQHLPVPGIPETTADIETTVIVQPEMILATSEESAKNALLRKVPATVNIEYIEVLVREF